MEKTERLQGELRALEVFCLLYDIAIDHEAFNPDWLQINVTAAEERKRSDDPYPCEVTQRESARTLRPWERLRCHIPELPAPDVGVSFREEGIPFLPQGLQLPTGWKATCQTALSEASDLPGDLREDWKRLLVAKRARALLQGMRRTEAFDALDTLGLRVVQAMPTPPRQLTETAESARLITHVLFRLEASACLHGYHSIGHADDCSSLIQKKLRALGGTPPGKGLSPYELVALYNKAQGYLHIREHERAFEGFKEVAGYLDLLTTPDSRDVHYWADDDSVANGPYAWPRVWAKRLFRLYVGYPSVLQAAETLTNLQRSRDAEHLLDAGTADFADSSDYQRARRGILVERIYNDTFAGDSDPRPSNWPGVAEGGIGNPTHNIRLQRDSVDAERHLITCRTRVERLAGIIDDPSKGAEPVERRDVAPVVEAMQAMSASLVRRMGNASNDRSEADQAVLAWVGAAALLPRALETAKNLIEKGGASQVCVDGAAEMVSASLGVLHLELPSEMAWSAETGSLLVPSAASVQDLALDLCVDRERRYRQAEACDRLVRTATQLVESARAPIKLGKGHDDYQKAVASLLDEAVSLAERMLDPQILSEMTSERAVPRHLRHYWDESAAIASRVPSLLPLAPDGNAPGSAENLHRDFRCFLSSQFIPPRDRVTGLDKDSPKRNQAKDPFEECVRCRVDGPSRCFVCSVESKHVHVVNAKCPARGVWDRGASFLPNDEQPELLHHYYDRLLRANRSRIAAHLYEQRKHRVPESWGFAVLQRWNSYTPAMAASEGGGYFLFHTKGRDKPDEQGLIDLGVVIDPGYGFLKNYLSQGYGIRDIHVIVVTHDHPDHLSDFEAITNLLLEAQNPRSTASDTGPAAPSKVDAVLSEGAFERLKPVLESGRDVFRNTFVLKPNDPLLPLAEFPHESPLLRLEPTIALHKDASRGPEGMGLDSIGMRAVLVGMDGKPDHCRIGVPSDTKWSERVVAEYTGGNSCALVCAHLGSFAPEDFLLADYFCESETSARVLHKKWQLYLPGVFWFVRSIANGEPNDTPTLVMLSEFGEEMSRGLRVDLAKRLDAYAADRHRKRGNGTDWARRVVIVPADVGMIVDPIGRKMQCSCCEEFYPWGTPMEYEVFGDAEQIFYVCPECDHTLSQDQKFSLFRSKQAPLMRLVRD